MVKSSRRERRIKRKKDEEFETKVEDKNGASDVYLPYGIQDYTCPRKRVLRGSTHTSTPPQLRYRTALLR